MKRRQFITLLGGAAAWPLAARAQQPAQVRRIGVLMPFAEDHPVGQARVAAFLQGLRQLGWTDGHNVRIDYRWSAGDSDNIHKFASELIAACWCSPGGLLALMGCANRVLIIQTGSMSR